MKITVVFVALGVAAILLGLFVAIPLFNSNLNHPAQRLPGGKANITTDVVYAYFSLNPYSKDTAGLSRSSINTAQTRDLISYLLVVNVTSHSKTTVDMNNFEVYAAGHIKTNKTDTAIAQSISAPLLLYSVRVIGGQTDSFQKCYSTAASWEPDQSRLVVFSGTTEIRNTTILESGTVYVGSRVEGTPIDGVYSSGVDSKQITVKTVGNNEFLYNNLLGPNQVLRLIYDGQFALVEEGQ